MRFYGFFSPLQHLKPSEQDLKDRAELLDQLFEILGERFGFGFKLEYVGIGRYAADIKLAPLEIAIVVRAGIPVLIES